MALRWRLPCEMSWPNLADRLCCFWARCVRKLTVRADPPDRSGSTYFWREREAPCCLKHPASDICAPEATVAHGQPYAVFMHTRAAAYSPTRQCTASTMHAQRCVFIWPPRCAACLHHPRVRREQPCHIKVLTPSPPPSCAIVLTTARYCCATSPPRVLESHRHMPTRSQRITTTAISPVCSSILHKSLQAARYGQCSFHQRPPQKCKTAAWRCDST